MNVTYSQSIDAAYIYLVPIEDGQASRTYPCDPKEVGGMINLDFDSEGRLLGIEVLDASKLLPEAVLTNAKLI